MGQPKSPGRDESDPAQAPVGQPRFDIRGAAPERRSKLWSDALNKFYFSYDTVYPSDFLIGEFEGATVDGRRAATLTADPMYVHRNAPHIAKDGLDAYFLIMSCGSSIGLGQRSAEITLQKEQFSLVSTTEPYFCGQNQTGRFHTLLIPGPLLRARKPDADDHLAGEFLASGLQRIFADLVGSFCSNASDLDPSAFLRTNDNLLDMLALVLEQTDAASNETVVRSAHRRRVMNFIESRYRDPGVGLVQIAQALNLSPRYVQQILSASGETVSDLLRGRRVAEACRLLDRRGVSRASIAAIAYSVGYADPAYFSRVFRRVIGVSPMDYASRTG